MKKILLAAFVTAMMVSCSDSEDEPIVNPAPHYRAYVDKNLYCLSNDGGTFTIPVHANTTFRLERTLYVTGSGENTRRVDTSWLSYSDEHKRITPDASSDYTYNVQLSANLNTGLGRKAFLQVYADSVKNDSNTIIEIRQNPRKLNESETIDLSDPFSLSLHVLLGNDTTNLERIKNLKIVGYVTDISLQYFAGLGNLSLDTLDLSDAYFGKYIDEIDREIENRQFFKTRLHNISLPNDLATIGEEAFAACPNIETITIPSTVTRIRKRAFANSSSMKSIVIPQDSKLKSLGSEAFNTGSVIESLFIPSTVYDLSPDALVGLQAKELHISLTTPPTMTGSIYSGCTLYVPKGCADKYKAADYWKEYKNIVEE